MTLLSLLFLTSSFLLLPPSSLPAPLSGYLVHPLHVLTQPPRRGEAGGAHLAGEGLLPRVHPLVCQEGRLALQLLLAVSALELRLRVHLPVVLQAGHVAEALPALLAQELVLRGVGNVPVLPAQGQGLEGLGALRAGVGEVLVLGAPVLLEGLLGGELLAALVAVVEEVGQPLLVLLFGSLGGISVGLLCANVKVALVPTN